MRRTTTTTTKTETEEHDGGRGVKCALSASSLLVYDYYYELPMLNKDLRLLHFTLLSNKRTVVIIFFWF